MFQDRKNSVAFGADVVLSSDLPVGTMKRKTLYRMENFAPLSVATIRHILGDFIVDNLWADLSKIAVYREGELRIPLGGLIDTIKSKGFSLGEEDEQRLRSTPVWVEQSANLVVMAGLTDSLDKHFKASAYTAAWYVGLVSGSPTFAEGNTMASHAGWFEIDAYTGATRPTLTLGTVVSGSVDNAAAKASYSINANMVIGGAFLVTLPTAEQTSGTLYGGAAFSGGNRTVQSGDTLNVTVTLTATAA